MRGAVAERRRADFDIPAPLPRVCSHIRGADVERTRADLHFLRTMMVWSARFRGGRGKLGVGSISCGADFAPAPPPLRDRACVNTCNDLCWSQFSARKWDTWEENSMKFIQNIHIFYWKMYMIMSFASSLLPRTNSRRMIFFTLLVGNDESTPCLMRLREVVRKVFEGYEISRNYIRALFSWSCRRIYIHIHTHTKSHTLYTYIFVVLILILWYRGTHITTNESRNCRG